MSKSSTKADADTSSNENDESSLNNMQEGSNNTDVADAPDNAAGDETTGTEGADDKFDASKIEIDDLTLTNCNKYLNEVTDVRTIKITPTMLLLTLPNIIPEERNGNPNSAIQANIFDVNHNDPNPQKGYEIINSMTGDIYETSFNTFKDMGWGKDGEILMLNIDVSLLLLFQTANLTN